MGFMLALADRAIAEKKLTFAVLMKWGVSG
jgi:hypothetical protein